VKSSDPESSETESAKPIPISLRLARAGLRIVAILYGVGARIHRVFMRRTSAGRGRLACAVVSVGGLTVGGAGKTPVAARLALGLQRRGWRVVLASRGYRGRNRSPVMVVSDGSHIHSSVERSGDESFVLAAHAPGVPVLVGRDRRVVGHHAVSAFDAEILILDDGFQHHRLARDLDLVCIDAAAGLGNHRLLPAGPLREPISALRHADWLCVVDGDWEGGALLDPASCLAAAERAVVSRLAAEGREVVRARRSPVDLRSLDHRETMSIDDLDGRRVGLISGIGRPDSFRRTLEGLGARVVVERRFRDHHAYRPQDCSGLGDPGLFWITTEKDALKILPEWIGQATLWVLRIEVEIADEDVVLARLEACLRRAGRLADRPAPVSHEAVRVVAVSAAAIR
jgi:tetraacyldisaccharide 4'-kinase